MRLKGLILLLFATLWLAPEAGAAPSASGELRPRQAVEMPQWSDLGMCDVLAVTGGSTLTPPTTVRVLHNPTTGVAATAAASRRSFAGSRMLAPVPLAGWMHGGYIYRLRCLRL